MKKIILLAAACCLPALAAAQVQLYGELKSGVETSRLKTGSSSVSGTRVADFGSHIGLRGSHPVGSGGNRLLWQWSQEAPVAGPRSGSLREQWSGRRQSGESYIGFGRE